MEKNNRSSYMPGELKSSTLNNIDAVYSESKQAALSKGDFKSSQNIQRWENVMPSHKQMGFINNSVSDSGSSFSLSLNLVLNRVNGVLSNIEKEENMEKEKSEFIKFLTSSIFANALKILVDDK